MAALVQAFFRQSDNEETKTLELLVIFCGAGLLMSILFAIYGPLADLSPGYF
jgi:hypothetical protein